MATVKDLLLTHTPAPAWTSNGVAITTKRWADEFPRFARILYHGPMQGPASFEDVRSFLGPDPGTPSMADHLGLATPAYPLNHPPQYMENEADAVRVFYQDIIAPVALAFSGSTSVTFLGSNVPLQRGGVRMNQRSESGPQRGPQGATHNIDFQMVMPHSDPLLSQPAIIGEIKKPGSINPNEWKSDSQGVAGSATRALQRELRGYAWKYACPQVFIFDGDQLVLVQFRALSSDDIRDPDCEVDVCVISYPDGTTTEPISTMQFALYYLCWTGFRRLCGTMSCQDTTTRGVSERAPLQVRMGNLFRDYVYFSGEPCWYMYDSDDEKEYPTPRGWKRLFEWQRRSNDRWGGYWYWTNGYGKVADTVNCFI